MESGEYLHILGMGSMADWEEGRGTLYYIEDKNGEIALPVFTTAERADEFAQANFNTPEAHMDMLESVGVSHAPVVTAGHYVVMPLSSEGLAKAALMVGANYAIRDPCPGSEQEILRLD